MEKKYKLEPFDIEKAKAGEPVCTKDGKDVRIICFDRNHKSYPIIALTAPYQEIMTFKYNGKSSKAIENFDLMMKVEVKEPYIYAEVAEEILPFERVKVIILSYLKSLNYLIIKTYDGKFLKIWKNNRPSQTWEEAQISANKIGEGWKCPTRHEWTDIYDVRFKGLDEAMKEIGGDSLIQKYWTSDEESIPSLQEYYAFSFDCGAFTFEDDAKSEYRMVRPVCLIDNI